MPTRTRGLLLALLAAACLPLAAAHVPVAPRENRDLASAYAIPDPFVSFAIYGELEAGGARYYRLEVPEGAPIRLALFASPANPRFLPTLVLAGPGLPAGEPPTFVEMPANSSAVVVEAADPAPAVYEPFSPGALHPVSTLDVPSVAGGTYYVIVYAYEAGRFSLASGEAEAWTFEEWASLPASRSRIWAWEGHDAPVVYGIPLVAGGLLAAATLLLWRRRGGPGPFGAAAALAGIFMAATAPVVLFQAVWAAGIASADPAPLAISLVFAVVPAVAGGLALGLGLRKPARVGAASRVLAAVAGVLGFAALAGYGLGPLLALAASALPARPS